MIKKIETTVNELKKGHMIILVDDKDRENEGDLVIAAEYITPEAINFMATHARGLICLAMAPELIDRLRLPLMAQNNLSQFGTNFTVSIDARDNISTGISAYDRARTVLTAIAEAVSGDELVSPGHTFPLRANKHGVLQRRGQTEGSVDLACIAGLKSAAVICEIMNKDGSMSRESELKKFAKLHRLKMVSVADVVNYRLNYDDSIIEKVTATKMPTKYGEFKLFAYNTCFDGQTHLVLVKGEIKNQDEILVRIHSECLTGDVFGSARCDCGSQLTLAMQKISQEGSGVIVYLRQEGRGIGLANKIKAYELQDYGLDTVQANHELGFQDDLRDYGIAAQILDNLGVSKIKLLTNNPGKVAAFSYSKIKVVERVPLEIVPNKINFKYLETKKNKMGHFLNLV